MLNWIFGEKKSTASATPTKTSTAAPAPEIAEKVGTPTNETSIASEPIQIQIRSEGPVLAKPSNAEEETLYTQLQVLVDDCDEHIAAKDFDLPMLPAVAMNLLELLQKPNASMNEVTRTVQTDPIMTAKFLRMANSAYYSSGMQIVSIQQAIMRMGLNVVKNVVMSIALHGTIFKDKRLTAYAEKFWKHSTHCAVAAQQMAGLIEGPLTMAFMAGLLHDIGKVPTLLFMLKVMPKDRPVRPEFIDALLEQHHVRVGVSLLNHWSLPLEARIAVASHHAVTHLSDAQAQVKIRLAGGDHEAFERHTQALASVILADRALTSLNMADEPGEVYIVGAPLARDLGLEDLEAMNYLQSLPTRLQECGSFDNL